MEEKIKSLLVSLAIKLKESKVIIDKIKNTDDVESLANIAILFLNKSANGRFLSDFMRLRTLFCTYYGYNITSQKAQIENYKRSLSKFSGLYLDGNFSNDHFVPWKLKVLIPEKDFNTIAYNFYTSSSEIIHDFDRLDNSFKCYFFSEYGDAIVYNGVSKVSMALITYVRRNSNGNLVIKKYIVRNGKLDYEEVEISSELEKLYYTSFDKKGNMIETYEKMYVDACNEGGIYAFLELMSIIDKVNMKKVGMIRNILDYESCNKTKEVQKNGLQKTSGNALSRC